MFSSNLPSISVLVLSIATGGCGGGKKGTADASVDRAADSGNPADGPGDRATESGNPSDGSHDVSPSDAHPTDVSPSDVGASCFDAGGDAGGDASGVCLFIIPLFNTGVDANGVALAGGSIDPHYKLIQSADTTFTGPDAIVTSQIAEGFWVPQSDTAKWIAPSANQSYPGASPCNASGTYIYRTSFDLTGYDPTTARINGQWGADNSGTAVRLNGVSQGITAGGYAPLTPFTIESGFVAGTNTLEFEIVDLGCPNGLRVELVGLAAAAGG